MATNIECPAMSTPKHLGPIKAIATYELVANQIQRAVHLGLLVPGDRLPAERALAQQLGVARMTVREAIRVLAHEGRITVRRGAHGGMWIRAQDVTRRELVQLAADTDRGIGDVYDFRRLIEGESARLAAEHCKAKDLRKRLASYFRGGAPGGRSAEMVARARAIEYVVTSSETEALLLEDNFIKEARPPFNLRLRDDKSYPFIEITLSDEWPRVRFFRGRHAPGNLYFGP